MKNVPREIVVHHDGVSRSGSSFAIVNDFHKGREFPLSSFGYYVGYHYWIERDGTVIKARAETDEGAHCIGHNTSSIGIGLAGNFDVEMPTEAQVTALGRLLSEIVQRHNIPVAEIRPHRAFANKSCYGSLLIDNWAKIVYLQSEVARIQALILQMESTPAEAAHG